MNSSHHIPVLTQEFLNFFESVSIRFFVDATLGAGGHSKAILQAHPEIQMLYGFDQDQKALKLAKENLAEFRGKVQYIQSNFYHLPEELDKHAVHHVEGILMDIGVSSMQIDQPERGFSFSKEGPLDMRMDQDCTLTAEEIVNEWSKEELCEIFIKYGDIARPRHLVDTLIEHRQKKRIKTTKELTEILTPAISNRVRSLPPMTLVFQALRIAVNNELRILEESLNPLMERLSPGGRLSVISFHSGEDRLVKQAFKSASSGKNSSFHLLTKKPVVASVREAKANSRSKSAKMRVIEKNKE